MERRKNVLKVMEMLCILIVVGFYVCIQRVGALNHMISAWGWEEGWRLSHMANDSINQAYVMKH